ncbi:uncharacterized protein [Scyliorhinus torazame]|uniref:uncharacterized protein isoform X1 n=1 Tax=Scyliorhinus torazame TaxID=75743 RepID=UPI003B5BAFA7
MSEYSSLRSDGVCETDAKITMSNGIPSNSDHEMLKSKETPSCPRKDKSNANLHTKLKAGWSSSETMRVNNSSSSLDSDSADWTGRGKRAMRKTLRKTVCPRVKRVDNTECKCQISTGNVVNTARGLLETQHWKNKANIDQESGDSNDPGRGRSMRKKLRKKKVRRRGARKEAEVKDEELVNCVNKDHQKTAQEKEERQENTNDLEDGYVDSVTRNEAVEDGFLRNEAETFDNHPNSVEEEMPIAEETEKGPGGDIQAQNPTIGNEETPIKDRTDVMQQTSINEESADLRGEDVLGRERKVECTEEKIQGGNSENAERPSKKINQKLETHLSKDNQLCKDVELAAWVREKLALVLQRAECIRSEAELSDTSEASKSEEWKESEEDAKNPTEGRMRIDDEVDEIGQRSPNELMKNKDSVYTNAPLLDGRQDDGVTASSGSAQPTQMKFCNPMTPHPGQTRGNLSGTSSRDTWDVAALSSANCLKEGGEPCHFSCNGSPLMGNKEVREATFPKQKLKGLGKFDEHHPLQMPPPMFANPSDVIGREESEDKLTSPGKRPNFQPLDHLTPANGPGRKRLPTQCNMEFGDGYINSKPGTCTDEDQSASTEQLLAKPAPEDKEEDETTLIVSPWGQQAEGRLRKQVMDTVTVLKACRSVGQLILRNTGLTDDLLETLVSTLINSESEVETINLNLNNLGPHSAELLVELLKAKPSVKCLLLYGNKLGDKGIGILMNGFTDLFMAEKAQETRASISVGEQPLPCQKWLQLAELDIGSNQLTNEGLKSVAKFLRLNPPLDYLGLSRNDAVHLTGWCELFDILKDNRDVSHLLLDGNVLGNEGAKYLAEVLRVNGSLCKVELDWNEIGDEGGLALSEALSFNPRRSLTHLSLDGNELSLGIKKELKALLSENKQGRLHTIGHGFSTFF